jgi:hypothetical protein
MLHKIHQKAELRKFHEIDELSKDLEEIKKALGEKR